MAEKSTLPSERELQVLQLIADGLTDEQIGQHLGIAKDTVSIHRKRLLEKLNANNVALMVANAFRKGLVN
ncbi:MAG: helix-turn-helix transcriptional regulator [Bacteroidota bacterium]